MDKPRSDWERQRDQALEWAKDQLDNALEMVEYCEKDSNKHSRDAFQRDVWMLKSIVRILKEAKEPEEK